MDKSPEEINGEFYQKMDEIEKINDSEKKIEELFALIGYVESYEEYGLSYFARLTVCEEAIELGQNEIFLDNFFWCLELFDDHPTHFEYESILWHIKWAVDIYDKYPYVPKDDIENLMKNMKEKYKKAGYSLRPYYQYRHLQARRAGDSEGAKKYFEKWINATRDEFSDCVACETQFQMEYFFEIGKTEEAFKLAEKMINNEISCGEIPHRTYAELLIPLYENGDVEQANFMHQRGLFLVRNNQKFIVQQAKHLFYLSLLDVKKAYAFFDKHIELLDDTNNGIDTFYFYLASWFLLERAKKLGIYLNEPVDYFKEVTLEVANLFDERNDNTFYNDLIKKHFQCL